MQMTEGSLRTYIFLDVDGVLNVSASVLPGAPALLLSERNLQYARSLAQGTPRPKDVENAEKILSIAGCELGHGEGGTYSELATPGDSATVPLFVERFVRLLRAAGPHCRVVLCSSWRAPKHQGALKRLEQDISRYLGEDFAFEEKTPLRHDNTPSKRLRCIGDYIHDLGAPSKEDRVRVLVLDDLFMSGLDAGPGRKGLDAVREAERYLRGRAQAPDRVSVRLVKPFEEWATPTGCRVQIGAGLTMQHFCRAMLFLGADAGCGCCHAREDQRKSSAEISDASTTDEAPEEGSPVSSEKEGTAPRAAVPGEARAVEGVTSGGRAGTRVAAWCMQAPAWLTAALLRISPHTPKRRPQRIVS